MPVSPPACRRPAISPCISQSGAITAGLVEWSAAHDIGFSAVVSLGDKIDVDFGDLLDFFALDGMTRAILLYVESINNARKFMSAARAAARIKPVRGGQVRPPCARRQGGADAYRRARRLGRGLRRGVPPRRPVARARSRRAVRRGRDARAGAAVSGQAAGDPHQWRRHRRARRRSARRSRRDARRPFPGHHEEARCGAAADLVARQSRRHRRRRRCRPLHRRPRAADRGSGERRHPGHERADRARLRRRTPRDRSLPPRRRTATA